MPFEFHTDEESQAYCERIVLAMQLLYDIDEVAGCQLINQQWQGYDWRDTSNGGTSEHFWLIYHELERDWAARIGNPNPYGEGIETDRWKEKEVEAEQRLSEFKWEGLHDWLYPSEAWAWWTDKKSGAKE